MTTDRAVDAVDRRFQLADKNHPVISMLYDVARGVELRRGCAAAHANASANDPSQPEPDINRYLSLKAQVRLLPLETIRDRIKLPVLPICIVQLQAALEENASADRIAEILSMDPKLTAAVMSLVNSALFALPNPVESLSRAITLIGTREVSSLALGVRLVAMFEESTPGDLPLETFWKHSMACAVLAQGIAARCRRPDPEKYLVAGLLHDLGRVMLYSGHPELSSVSLALHMKRRMPLHEVEELLFDVDHCLMGSVFFSEWNLPASVVQSCLLHHNPGQCLGKDVPEVVYVANQIASALGLGCSLLFTLPTGTAIWEKLGLDHLGLAELVEESEEHLLAMFRAMFPTTARE